MADGHEIRRRWAEAVIAGLVATALWEAGGALTGTDAVADFAPKLPWMVASAVLAAGIVTWALRRHPSVRGRRAMAVPLLVMLTVLPLLRVVYWAVKGQTAGWLAVDAVAMWLPFIAGVLIALRLTRPAALRRGGTRLARE